MKIPASVKTFLSPFLATVFCVMAVTGLLMLAGVHSGTIREVHEATGLFFVAAGLFHLVVNFRQLSSYLKLRRSWIAIVAAAAIVAFAALGGDEGARRQAQHQERAGQQ